MEKIDYTLGIKIYTDGDFGIDNNEEINLRDYIDYETYFMVKTFDAFYYAKDFTIHILNHIKNNIHSTKNYIVDKIKNSIDNFIKDFSKLTKEEFLKRKVFGLYLDLGNQRMTIEFTSKRLSYEMRTFALEDRLQEFANYIKENCNETWQPLLYRSLQTLLDGKDVYDCHI